MPCGSRKPIIARFSAALSAFAMGCWIAGRLALESVAKIGGCEPNGLLCFGFVLAEEVKEGDALGVKVGGMADLLVAIGGTLLGFNVAGCFVVKDED